MRMSHRRFPCAAVLALVSALTVNNARAQGEPAARARHSIGLTVGVSQFDLVGTGTTAIVGARADIAMQSWLLAEGALSTFRPAEQLGRTLYLVPEAQLQFQVPSHTIRPYVGVGGGYVLQTGLRRITASAATGVRIPITAVDLRGELRVRGIGTSFSAATAEWTFGAAYRF